jgi:hypothetical protein
MYVAPKPDRDWLWSEQRKLYTRSEAHSDDAFRKLWGLCTDTRNLRMAAARAAGDRGRRTAGVDGVTVACVVGLAGIRRGSAFAGAARPHPEPRRSSGVSPPGYSPRKARSRSIMESRVHNERCTPGSEGGARKPTGASRNRRRVPTLQAENRRDLRWGRLERLYRDSSRRRWSRHGRAPRGYDVE